MPKITALIGPSAAGKSTLARSMVRVRQNNTVRANRDSLRNMLFDGEWTPQRERLIKAVERVIVAEALKHNYNVVIDDTNLSEGVRASWEQLAAGWNTKLEWKTLDTDFDTCVFRDSLRTGKEQVGRAVIERQFLSAGLLKFDSRPIVIFDVDGTLADIRHRLHFVQKQPKDWYGFYANCHLDPANEPIMQWAKNLVHWRGYCMDCYVAFESDEGNNICACEFPKPAPNYNVIVVSGRPIRFKDIETGRNTVNWLDAKGVPYSHVFMRHEADHRDDTVVKEEILQQLLKVVPKEQIAFVVDDRPSVIRMWQSHGLKVYPAAGACPEF